MKHLPLNCKKGCCRERLLDLAEQHFQEQDMVMNALANEHIMLVNLIDKEVIPYLDSLARSGDEWAKDLMIDLSSYV